MQNIRLWMPIGLSVGLCPGLVSGHHNEDDNEDQVYYGEYNEKDKS